MWSFKIYSMGTSSNILYILGREELGGKNI